MKTDNEIISTVVFPPSVDSRTVIVIYKRKYVHEVQVEVQVEVLVKLAQEKVWLGELSVSTCP